MPVTPFLAWVGGKRYLIKQLALYFPEKINTYWEPFLGGGSVFFYLHNRADHAVISDINLDLVITYQVVKDNPSSIFPFLIQHSEHHPDPAYYYYVRDEIDPKTDLMNRAALAARFIYLNKAAYSNLYRENKQGRFNASRTKSNKKNIYDEAELVAASMALQKATIHHGYYQDVCKPDPGDFVYLDPPYDGRTFEYTSDVFGRKDQRELSVFATRWRDAGTNVLLSNSSTPFIREIYQGWYQQELNPVVKRDNTKSFYNTELVVSTTPVPYEQGELLCL